MTEVCMAVRRLFARLSYWLILPLSVYSCATTDENAVSEAAARAGDPDALLVVDCLLPGQLHKLGQQFTYLTQRPAIKTTAVDCEIRGGEYVAYDRANYSTSLKIWLPRAQDGDPAAQTYVGEIYEKGLGVLSDYPIALQWYMKAATQNYSRAQINLGYLYESGLGVERNLVEAMNWYRKASGLSGGELEFVSSIEAAQRQSATVKTEQLRTEVIELRSETERMQREISARKARLKTSEAEVVRLAKQIEAKKQAGTVVAPGAVVVAPDAGASADELKKQLDQVASERQDLIAQLAEQQLRVEQLRNDLQQREATVAQRSHDVAALQTELETARKELSVSQATAANNKTAEIESIRLQSVVDSLEAEVEKQKDNIARLEQGNRSMHSELQSSLASSGDRDQSLHRQLQDKDQELAALRMQIEEHGAAVSTLEQELIDTRSEQERLGKELQQQQGEVERLRAEIDQSTQLTEKRRLELDKTRNELAMAKRAMSQQKLVTDETSKAQAAAWSARVLELDTALKNQQSETGRLENQARRREGKLNDELHDIQQKQGQLELVLSTRNQEVESLQSQLEISQQALAAQGAASVTAIAALEKELQNRQAEIAIQKQEIEKMQTAAAESVGTAQVSDVSEFAAVEIPVALGPSIEIIEPPIALTRGTPMVRLRSIVPEIEIIGRVTPASELLSFRINDLAQKVDQRGLFQSKIQLQATDAAVHAVAVDKFGQRTKLDFVIQPAKAKKAAPTADPTPGKATAMGVSFGTYHALVIGNNNYGSLPDLRTARSDASAVARVLEQRYGFKTTLLLDADRYAILSALNKLRKELDEESNLLIYYAGHGELDNKNLRGYWLPVDSETDSSTNWISNVAITDILNVMAAKHILVVADSCYSGTLTRSSVSRLDTGMTSSKKQKWYEAMSRVRARLVLSSGGVQPVLDSGGGEHSVFARAFLDVLQDNEGILEGFNLYRSVQAKVKGDTAAARIAQNPQYAPIKYAGHEAGEFLFPPVRSDGAYLDAPRELSSALASR